MSLKIIISSNSINGTEVQDFEGNQIGTIEDVMINCVTGDVQYLVLSFGGLFGTTINDKRFAVPFNAITIKEIDDPVNMIKISKKVIYQLNITKEFLENASGFDKDNYPDFADENFISNLEAYYKNNPQLKAA